jgi:hypothetical protein
VRFIDHLKSNWQRYAYGGFLFGVSLVGAWLGAYRGESEWNRAGVFFVVAAVLLAELLAMVGRTPEDRWDGLAISMAFFRASVVNYIASLAFSLTDISAFPEWWWASSRAVMGLFAAIALFFMVIEDWNAWSVMSRGQRIRGTVLPILYLALLFTVALIW